MKLDIGIASYGNAVKLRATLDSILKHSVADWQCFIIDNPGPDTVTREVIAEYHREYPQKFTPVLMDLNVGYAGAVNILFDLSQRKDSNIIYCDNDVEIHTPGWDLAMCYFLDAHPECAQVFPGYGHYGFYNGAY